MLENPNKSGFFPFFKDISWFENRNLGEEGGEDEDVLLFEEVYWRWFWGAAKTKDLISFFPSIFRNFSLPCH